MNEIDSEIKKLILWRIETGVPKHFKLCMGGKGTFSKDELKEHVEKEDEIGRDVIKMQLQFIKALSSGEFTKALAEE